jgi:integrase
MLEKGVFSKSLRTVRRLFQQQRARLAKKLQNPRLLQIHFHTFRHWKATMLYHQTKGILYAMNFLGHRNIKNTLLYVQLEGALFKGNDEYICKAAGKGMMLKRLLRSALNMYARRRMV